jgi:aryl-alcohol dehydrogenase-like predicted oxidoreductase
VKMRFLGQTGLKVSELCFGALTFGDVGPAKNFGGVVQRDAETIVGFALEAGINFFDTADVYSEGVSEEMLGKALGTHRKDIILATKVRGRMGERPNDIGLSRHHMLEACDASLKRLKTDYIDLYQLHSYDSCTRLEDTLHALDDLVRCGKVRYIGCSNFAGWQMMKSLSISEKYGWEKFVSTQVLYSLVSRDIENEIVPVCIEEGLSVLVWSPLANGFLSGKYRRGQPRPSGGRISDPKGDYPFLPFDEQKGFDIVEELDRIAKEHQATVAQAALNYLLRKPGVTSVTVSARKIEQLKDNIKTIDWEMTSEEVARLDALSKPALVYPYWYLDRNPLGR